MTIKVPGPVTGALGQTAETREKRELCQFSIYFSLNTLDWPQQVSWAAEQYSPCCRWQKFSVRWGESPRPVSESERDSRYSVQPSTQSRWHWRLAERWTNSRRRVPSRSRKSKRFVWTLWREADDRWEAGESRGGRDDILRGSESCGQSGSGELEVEVKTKSGKWEEGGKERGTRKNRLLLAANAVTRRKEWVISSCDMSESVFVRPYEFGVPLVPSRPLRTSVPKEQHLLSFSDGVRLNEEERAIDRIPFPIWRKVLVSPPSRPRGMSLRLIWEPHAS